MARNDRPVGWRKEPARHALAARGIKTTAPEPKYDPKLALKVERPDIHPALHDMSLKKWVDGLTKKDWKGYGTAIQVFGSATDSKVWDQHWREWLEGKRVSPPDIDIVVDADQYGWEEFYDDPEEGVYQMAIGLERDIMEMFENKYDEDHLDETYLHDPVPGNLDIWVVSENYGIYLCRCDDYSDNLEDGLDLSGAIELDDWIESIRGS